MKKNICLLLVVGIGMCSCSSYHYAILDSKDLLNERNVNGEFLQEKDSISIAYSFFGENAPVRIAIYNDRGMPAYVDWNRSAIIIDDVVTPYGNEGSQDFDTEPGRMDLPRGVSFVPPQSMVRSMPFYLMNFSFDEIPKKDYKDFSYTKENGEKVNLPVLEFNEDNTPLRFRSYITVYVPGMDNEEKRTIVFERSFYIHKLFRAGSKSPTKFNMYKAQSGDFFYVRKVKGETTGLIIGVVGVSVAGALVGAAIGPTYY